MVSRIECFDSWNPQALMLRSVPSDGINSGISMLLSHQNIESELSYAYLHAVASRAGFECTIAGRQSDGDGIDARLWIRERFHADSLYTRFGIDVQLKATSGEPVLRDGRYSYSLKVEHYDKLRDEDYAGNLLLVVLFLPSDSEQWLVHTEDELAARRCAYWVPLRGAPPSSNSTAQTVYLPQ
jgi:hypothetical protein